MFFWRPFGVGHNFMGPRLGEGYNFWAPFIRTLGDVLKWVLWSVTNVQACEPEPRAASRESIFASHCFFLIYLFIYLFLRFKFNDKVVLSKWWT